MMNNLSSTPTKSAAVEPKSTTNANDYNYNNTCISIPKPAIYILLLLLIIGLGVSIFILAEVHNAAFFIAFLFLSAFVLAFIFWNILSFGRNAAISLFLRRFPQSDLRFARHGQLVRLSGTVTCGDVALESSYEKVGKCVYTSTALYEYQGLKANGPCFLWRPSYIERFSTDFYILDRNSGIQVLVKAGCGCRVVPLVTENRLVNTKKNRLLSRNLTKWLTDRNLSANPSYIKEGDYATVMGMLHRRDDDTITVVQPPELISTGCLWQRLLLPVDFDGLILGISNI